MTRAALKIVPAAAEMPILEGGGHPESQKAPAPVIYPGPSKNNHSKTITHLFDLAPGWALGYDTSQWMLLRRRNFRTECGWKPVSFIASNRDILDRCIGENGIQPTPAAQAKLDALPFRFRDWLAMSGLEGDKA